jgi:hypothetical protein
MKFTSGPALAFIYKVDWLALFNQASMLQLPNTTQ